MAVHSSHSPRLIESHRIYTENLKDKLPSRLQKKDEFKKTGHVSILRLINYYSYLEKTGGGRPDYWEMVFWWTRKPLAGARFVVAASLLPGDTDIPSLARALRLLDDKSPHLLNPDLKYLPPEHRKIIQEASLLDSFAGFGSIPLEALRLGLGRVAAVELLPTAYVFLKAVLEYPARYGHLKTLVRHQEAKQLSSLIDWRALKNKGMARETPDGIEAPMLIVDLARAAQRILDELREDPDIRELYDPDVAVYIGTWEIRCPGTGKYSPMVGNWWLARVRRGNSYQRLAYMKPRITDNGEVEIEVIDLNKIHRDVASARVQDNTIELDGHRYQVPEPNIAPQSNTAICLQDGRPLGYIDPETGKTYTTKNQAPPGIRDRLEWYPKWAIKQWNKLYEQYLQGKATLEDLKNAPARPRLLAKVKIMDGGIEFQSATQEDNQKLWRALEKLKQLQGDPDIPTEPIPLYENRRLIGMWGFDKWFKLFSPRQLLTLTKLVKLIREAAKGVERLNEGLCGDKTCISEATAVYIAIALARMVNYNSLITRVDSSNPWGVKIAETLAVRGIAIQWNFGETNPFVTDMPFFQIQGSFVKSAQKIIDSVVYLLSATSDKDCNMMVLLGDASALGKLWDEKVSIIVTDPPYFDDVPYSELSDLFYVWLKRALSDVEDKRLVPRFLAEAFFRRVGSGWREIRTQWEEFARREISVNPPRFPGMGKEEAIERFERRLGAALRRAAGLLVDDGLIVTYYNHTSVDAWASLIRAGWELAGLRVSAAVPVVTEAGTRVTARGKVRLDTSIVVVWRRRSGGERCDASVVSGEALREARLFAERLVGAGVASYDLLFAALGRALSVYTGCGEIVGPEGRWDSRRLVEEAYRVAARAVAEALSGVGGAPVASGAGRFYMLSRLFFAEAGDIRLDGSAVGLLQIGLGVRRDEMLALRILGRPAKGAYPLLYPRATGRGELRRLLEKRGLVEDPGRAVVRNSVDVLHLLYYAAASGRASEALETLRARAPGHTEEALAIARTLCRLLPGDDPEKTLACRVAQAGGALDRWLAEG